MYGHEPILMCAACWRIQPLADELGSQLDQWIEPTALMARVQLGSGDYEIIDGYCDPCLVEMAIRSQRALVHAAHERTNA